ncbi:MAG: Holliday junction branch migration protein RuvA [Microbacteriaceae bacterium]
MISSLRGTVLSAIGSSVVIEVGGVGFAVQVTGAHALALRAGAEALVHTVLVVREDELSLFGFATAEELAVFELLRSVTGVGPKSALGVLAAMTPDEVAQAIAVEDDAAFRRVSGIGPKTAKLIVVSLAGRLVASAGPATAASLAPAVSDDVVTALVGLGWPEKAAAQAVAEAIEAAGPRDAASVPALLRRALALLGPAPARAGARP